MRVAIYARYSTDKQREESIEDQLRVCREYADKRGWKVVGTYADKASSGAKRDRPQFQKMLADADDGKFDVVLAEALDRLSRSLSDVAGLYDRLHYHKVHIWTCDQGEITQMHVGIMGTFAQMYLSNLADKTRRGQRGRVENGGFAGGVCYGYGAGKKRGERKVDPEQAKVVRRIFSWFAEGRGPKEIAVRLNANGVPSLRGGTWSAATIRTMLGNELYAGKVIWNKREWVRHYETRKRKPQLRDKDEIVTRDSPQLRIVDDDLWNRVQARRAELDAVQAERVRKRKHPKDHGGRSPQYLFSGIVKCGACGGNYTKQGPGYYRCSTYCNRGPKACGNSVSVKQTDMETKLLYAIKKELFDEKSFKAFQREVRRTLEQRLKDRNKDVDQLKRDLAKVEREVAGVVKLAKMGKASAALADELSALENRRDKIKADLNTDLPALANLDDLLERALSKYARAAYSLEDFAARDITKGRNLIRHLVGGSIIFEPTKGGGLNARMRGDYGGLIKLVGETDPSGIPSGGRRYVSELAGPRNHFRYNSLEIEI